MRVTTCLFLVMLAAMSPSFGAPIESNVLARVPEYEWYRGCTPTAVGMIFGYWGAQYPSLWGGTPPMLNDIDNPADPVNRYIDSLSLALRTDEGGTTYISRVPKSMKRYARDQGFYFSSKNVVPTYEVMKAEIDAGRPMHVAIQLVENYYPFGHSIVAYGYKTESDGSQWFAVRDTWLDGNSDGYDGLKAQVDANGVEWFEFETDVYSKYKILKLTYFRPPDPLKNPKRYAKMLELLAIDSSGWDFGGMYDLEPGRISSPGKEKIIFDAGLPKVHTNVNSCSLAIAPDVSNPVPEPGGIALAALAFTGALIKRRRR